MNILPSFLLTGAIIAGIPAMAAAYTLSPPDITAKLHGNLTFNPFEGSNPQPFRCKITLNLHTKGWIRAVKVDGPGNCGLLSFQDLPWQVVVTGSNSGVFGTVSFSSSHGNCVQNNIQFQDNSSGVFTLSPGQCLSGTLTSTPPVTIVP
jgi:hypothetical protein